jgi:hypothetical protein
MIEHYNVIQGSTEWFELKKLKMSASNATAIGNAGAGLTTYINKLVLESIIEPEKFTNLDMERGVELEPIARSKYEFEKNVSVIEVGFIESTFYKYVGVSPDGLVGDDGLIECKARNDEKHLQLLLTGDVDSGTIWQMNMQMLISGRQWVDFISYNPNFKNSLFVKRFFPDAEKIEKLKKGIEKGINLIEELLNNKIIKDELKK